MDGRGGRRSPLDVLGEKGSSPQGHLIIVCAVTRQLHVVAERALQLHRRLGEASSGKPPRVVNAAQVLAQRLYNPIRAVSS